jgi:hypothetical protein
VNGTGEGVIEFVLELANVLRLLMPLRTVDEVVCIDCVDREVLSDSKVSYAAKKVRLVSSVQKNVSAPSSVKESKPQYG